MCRFSRSVTTASGTRLASVAPCSSAHAVSVTLGLRSLPYYHFISTDQYIWVADGGTNRILKYDLDGHYLYGWSGAGGQPGQFKGPHQLTVDQEGNLYVAEVFNGRVMKFRPKPNADPAKVVGQELRHRATTD